MSNTSVTDGVRERSAICAASRSEPITSGL
jgi:hypothetical protein